MENAYQYAVMSVLGAGLIRTSSLLVDKNNHERILKYYAFYLLSLGVEAASFCCPQLWIQELRKVAWSFISTFLLWGVLLRNKSSLRPYFRKVLIDCALATCIMYAAKGYYADENKIASYFIPGDFVHFIFAYLIPYHIDHRATFTSFLWGPMMAIFVGKKMGYKTANDCLSTYLNLCQSAYALLLD